MRTGVTDRFLLPAAVIVWGIMNGHLLSQVRPSVTPVATRPLRAGQIDTEKSLAFARVEKTGLGHEHAIEGRIKKGDIILGAERNAGAIVFDLTSFQADTATARRYIGLEGETSASTQQQVNANMLGKDVLDVGKFPDATFEIDSAIAKKETSRSGNPLYQLVGKFTLHGTTRPLKVSAEVVEEEDRLRVRGGFKIKQTDFGITPFSKAFGTVGVADEMTIYGEIFIAKIQNAAQRSVATPR